MSSELRSRFAVATLLGAAVFVGPFIDPARAQSNDEKIEETITLTGENRSKMQLTIYPGNLGMIAEQRNASIPKGLKTLRIEDLPQTIMDDTFLMGAQTEAKLVWHTLRNTANGPTTMYRLLQDQIGKTITVRRKEDELVEGTLLSIDGGALVRTLDGIEQVPVEQIIISDLPNDFATRPAIEATIGSDSALDHVSLAYLLGGVAWQTAYAGRYDSDKNVLNLSAMARVSNQTGAAINNAQLRLIAGDPNRVTPAPMAKAARGEMLMSAMADTAPGGGGLDRETMEGLHVYGPFDDLSMRNGDVVMLPLFAPQVLPVTRKVTFNGSANLYYAGQSDISEFALPDLEIEVENDGGTDQKSPWPAGTIRVFGQSQSGVTGFLGEDNLSLTPVGRKATIRLGQASEISGTRKVTSFDRKSRPNMPDEIKANMEWAISNGSARTETVTIRENVPGDWIVTGEDHKHSKPQPDLLVWTIEVPAGKDVKLSWSVKSTR
ncbi:DUF4139 domain-containing protein [Thalassospira alkalitolerans]|uniref:DUF4139 domain-containing protein n=1 Tax=Thalassospira alkalitolerans TaxID=1293890 RepID=UPI003AA8DC75|tara:strand:- start:27203 stop:28678 length:1476 start_codon:yes stop_codon:yes gene_type:complete